MEYKGYDIETVAFPDPTTGDFHATYTIRRDEKIVVSGTVASGLKTAAATTQKAEAEAQRWIDQHLN